MSQSALITKVHFPFLLIPASVLSSFGIPGLTSLHLNPALITVPESAVAGDGSSAAGGVGGERSGARPETGRCCFEEGLRRKEDGLIPRRDWAPGTSSVPENL